MINKVITIFHVRSSNNNKKEGEFTNIGWDQNKKNEVTRRKRKTTIRRTTIRRG